MNRVDLYRTVHKGLRARLFRATLSVARTDFADELELAAAVNEVRGLCAFLDEHAEHEDAVILPELERLAPVLHADLRAEHVRTHGLQREIAGLLERLEGTAASSERTSIGRRLAERMSGLVAEHLRHMNREETDANRVLWAHRSDAELHELEGRILASIPPERMSEWIALMLPAMNRPERREMLLAMADSMPAEAFAQITGPARAELEESAWRDACPAMAR